MMMSGWVGAEAAELHAERTNMKREPILRSMRPSIEPPAKSSEPRPESENDETTLSSRMPVAPTRRTRSRPATDRQLLGVAEEIAFKRSFSALIDRLYPDLDSKRRLNVLSPDSDFGKLMDEIGVRNAVQWLDEKCDKARRLAVSAI
jgi:hypothetical protein